MILRKMKVNQRNFMIKLIKLGLKMCILKGQTRFKSNKIKLAVKKV
jgi:hypothetical protein